MISKILFSLFIFILTNIKVYGASELDVQNYDSTKSFIGGLKGLFSADFLLSIVLSVFIILVTLILSKIIRDKVSLSLEKKLEDVEGKDEIVGVIIRTVNIFILITGFSITLSVLGVDLGIFMGGIGFGIGFTLRTFLTNFISGIIMVTQGVYHSGDLIEINGDIGKIIRINSLFTTARNLDGVMFYIPNIKFLEDNVKNFSSSDKRRVVIEFYVDYENDLVRIKKVIDKVIENFPNILKAPESKTVVGKLDNNGTLLKVLFWISSKDSYIEMKSNVTETINLAFKKESINISLNKIEYNSKK